MTVIVVILALKAIKAHILTGIEGWKAQLPDALKPFAEQVAIFLGNLIDGIDAAALASSLPGQLADLIKSGRGPTSSQPADVA